MNIWFKRTKSEIKNLEKSSSIDQFLFVSESNMKEFNGFISGPKDSFYENYLFQIVVRTDDKYPMVAPKVYFKTKIFHPNIHLENGQVCLDLLNSTWKPIFNLNILLKALRDLLAHPNADSPLNCDAGKKFKIKQ